MQVQHQSEFEKDRIKSVGISLADNQFGPFELLIDQIDVLSGEDYWQYLNRAHHTPLSDSEPAKLGSDEPKKLE